MAKKKKKDRKDKVPEIASGLYERKTRQTPKKDETAVRKRCPKCAKIMPAATGKCQRCI